MSDQPLARRRRRSSKPSAAPGGFSDVFGGPPRHAAPFAHSAALTNEDYAEIFGGVDTSCSIPYLDLPPAGDDVDWAGGRVDYGEVFGRAEFSDFAVPYEDIVAGGGDGRKQSCGSSPVKRQSSKCRQEPSHLWSTYSSQDSSHGLEEEHISPNSFTSGLAKQFNMSYHKSVQVESDKYGGSQTITVEPPTSYMVDSLHMEHNILKKDSTNQEITNAAHDVIGKRNPLCYTSDTSIRIPSGTSGDQKQCVTTGFTKSDANEKEHDRKQRSSNRSASSRGPVPQDYGFLNVSDINVSAAPVEDLPPPRPPPKFLNKQKLSTVKNDESSTYMDTQSFVSGSNKDAHQVNSKVDSASNFNIEASTSSAAAASAAAMKEAMEQAEVRLRFAKELMQKKREGGKLHKNRSHVGIAEEMTTDVGKGPNNLDGFKESLNEQEYTKNIRHPTSLQKSGNAFGSTSLASNVVKEVEATLSSEDFYQMKSDSVSRFTKNVYKVESENWRSSNGFYELINNGKKYEGNTGYKTKDNCMQETASTNRECKKESNGIPDMGPYIQSSRLQENCSIVELEDDFEDVKEDFVSCDEAETASVKPLKTDFSFGVCGDNNVNQLEDQFFSTGQVMQCEVPQNYGEDKKSDLCWNEKLPSVVDCANDVSSSLDACNSEEVTGIAKVRSDCIREKTIVTTPHDRYESVEFRPFRNQYSTTSEFDSDAVEDANGIQICPNERSNIEWTTDTSESGSKYLTLPFPKNENENKRVDDSISQAEIEISEQDMNTVKTAFDGKLEESNNKGMADSIYADNAESKFSAPEIEESDSYEAAKLIESKLKAKMKFQLDDFEIDLKSVATTPADENNVVKTAELPRNCELPENVEEKPVFPQCVRIPEARKTWKASTEDVLRDIREMGAKENPTQYNEDIEEQVAPAENRGENWTEEHAEVQTDGAFSPHVVPKDSFAQKDVTGFKSHADVNVSVIDTDNGSSLDKYFCSKNFTGAVHPVQNIMMSSGEVLENENGNMKGTADQTSEMEQSRQVESTTDQLGLDVEEETEIKVNIKELQEPEKVLKTELNDFEAAASQKAADIPSSSDGTTSVCAHNFTERATRRIIEEEKEQEKRVIQKLEEEKEKERKVQYDREEKERLRIRMEEEREREREREKDKIAVERATREAHERASAEARERGQMAERLAMERITAARQRAELREREEKANSESKLLAEKAEKASREARLRAERAAVERATAEARERAMEKAKAEKAAADAKERMERIKSFNVKSNSEFPQQHDAQLRRTISENYIRDSDASKSKGNEESTIRHKARVERHQRTAERAAKALAEKNMRDMLAQREQVERNRLAEFLDPEIKRWSNGKEGNLRALLSTLQYILESDCGWQAVPLTELITAAAVKKTYRKATLCVHPDKLQQRGASVRQKYKCEKVFDLLKEAWNRFNSEER